MRITVSILAAGLVILGLWLIASGFMSEGSVGKANGFEIRSASQTTAGPVVVGMALLAGGTLFFVLLLRRR